MVRDAASVDLEQRLRNNDRLCASLGRMALSTAEASADFSALQRIKLGKQSRMVLGHRVVFLR